MTIKCYELLLSGTTFSAARRWHRATFVAQIPVLLQFRP